MVVVVVIVVVVLLSLVIDAFVLVIANIKVKMPVVWTKDCKSACNGSGVRDATNAGCLGQVIIVAGIIGEKWQS